MDIVPKRTAPPKQMMQMEEDEVEVKDDEQEA